MIQNLFPFVLSFVLSLIAFSSQSQIIISIGNPVDGGEGSGNSMFDVFIEGGDVNTTGAPITGSLSYGGTATSGADFTPVNSFSIPDGASSTTISIVVLDDALVECDESIIATLSNLNTGMVNPSASTDTAYIIDDECTNNIDELNEVGLTVYPNPVAHFVHFEAEQQMSNYAILDVHGRIMNAGKIDGMKHQIALDFLSKGTYFVEIHFENGKSINRKLVKE